MTRADTKMEKLADEYKADRGGATNRQIAKSDGFTKERIKQLVKRQNRKKCMIEAGYIPQGDRERMPGFVKITRSYSCV